MGLRAFSYTSVCLRNPSLPPSLHFRCRACDCSTCLSPLLVLRCPLETTPPGSSRLGAVHTPEAKVPGRLRFHHQPRTAGAAVCESVGRALETVGRDASCVRGGSRGTLLRVPVHLPSPPVQVRLKWGMGECIL